MLFWSMSLWLKIINRMSLWFNWTVCVEIGGDRVLVGLWCTVHILAQYPWDPLVIKCRHWKRSMGHKIVGWRHRWCGLGRLEALDGSKTVTWRVHDKNLKRKVWKSWILRILEICYLLLWFFKILISELFIHFLQFLSSLICSQIVIWF